MISWRGPSDVPDATSDTLSMYEDHIGNGAVVAYEPRSFALWCVL